MTPAPAPVQSAQPAAPSDATTSRTTIAPGAADVVDEARQPPARTTRTAPARQSARATPTRTAPAASAVATPAPVAAEPSAPAPAAPAPAPATTAPAANPVPVAETPVETAATTATTETDGAPLWPIAVIAALIVAAGAAFLLMRRRRQAAYDEYEAEPTYYEATPEPAYVAPVAEPAYVAPAAVAAAPIVAAAETPVVTGLADEPTVSDAPAEDVAALTDAAAPVRNRPWLEFAMRPVRAGTSADEALVEIELTVANSGTVAAENVRVSTFMLTDAHASEMENMLVDAPADASIDPMRIAAGEGTRIDATLAVLKADFGGEDHVTPVIVADARYTLPDGSEGRTSASFVFGVSDADSGALVPIDLADRVMRDDIEARLHGQVEHA